MPFFFNLYFLLSFSFYVLPEEVRRIKIASILYLQGKLAFGTCGSQSFSEYTFCIENTLGFTCIYKYANIDIAMCAC